MNLPWLMKVRLPNGDSLHILRRDILDAALGRRKHDPDFNPTFRSDEQAHRAAVRKKLDRANRYLCLIIVLLVVLVLKS